MQVSPGRGLTHTPSSLPLTVGIMGTGASLGMGTVHLPPMASMPQPAAPAWPGSGQEVRLCPDSLHNRKESFFLHKQGQTVASPSKGGDNPPRSHKHAAVSAGLSCHSFPPPPKALEGLAPRFP